MNPDITVVVPYHNERETIEYTLGRVGDQSLPAKVAIFVNSSSTDDTFDAIKDWIQKHQHRFHTQFLNIFENTDNPASSKNVGISHAHTEWIAFMDCGQKFEKDWLEKQFQFAMKTGAAAVGGVAYLIGENWVDRCAVTQVYGYKRNISFCVPTTLVRKTVFEKTGLFLEGRRAGYDIAWLRKLEDLGIERVINEDVQIRYIGFNYSSNLNHLFHKAILYAKPCVAIKGYLFPYLYIVFPLIVLCALAISYKLALSLIFIYFLMRLFVLPICKSRNCLFYIEHPFESFMGLSLVGLVIDLGKMLGTIKGIKYYYFSKSSPG